MTMANPNAGIALASYFAWGVATSPLPLAGLAVMLLADRARRTTITFTAVWFGCQLTALALFLWAAKLLGNLHISASTKTDIAWAMCGLGAVMVLSGVSMMLWQHFHPSGNSGKNTRAFLARAEVAGRKDAALMALATSGLNITNFPYWASIALVLYRANITGFDLVAAVLWCAFIASITFILSTAIVLASGDRLLHRVAWAKNLLLRHSGAVIPSFLLISGAVLLVLSALDLGWI